MLNYCDNRIAYYGFKKSNIFVYTNGNEGDNKIAIEEKVAKHFKYAFNINYSHNCPVNIPLQNRMDIGRIIIPRASEITAEMKAYYKNLIDKTINENKLMIISTHSDKSDYTYLTELLDYILNQGYSFTSPVKALSEIDEYRFQNKLIPGDNISITPDNIISASFTESDPTVPSHVKSITAKNISDWNNKSDFSGSYNDLVDTPAIPSIEGLAKTEDIPTTLPANGGNSDTVNNHTIESDVPTDAVFTDTIYDDTEVKESIEELNSNLDTLEYSEIAGGKNLANINDFKLLTTNPSRYGYEWINMKGGTYTFNITNGNNILYIGYKHNGEFVNPSSVVNNSKVQIITISDGDDIVIWYENGVTENTVTSLQLEVGGVATEYEPYIPSIKMLNKSLNNYALKSLYSDTTINIGRLANSTVGKYSIAEGQSTTASGYSSHAEGEYTKASGNTSHAEGTGTEASGESSHAEGFITKASGNTSHAEGTGTEASNFASHASGKYNTAMTTGGASSNTTGTAFVIGNGTSSSALSNAFSVQYSGIVKAKSTITASTTADYAEFFEWLDKNPNEEDRVGHFVTLDGDKIKIATSEDDYILGIVSGEPFVLGNGDCDTWNGMYLHDEFRRTIYEPAPKMIEILDSEGNPTGEYEEVEGEYEGTRPVLNPNYDQTKQYISRFDRAEWSPVGMLGVLAVLHDGTAEVNGYVTVNNEGIATKCTRDTRNSYRVIKKVSDKVVEVIFR